MVLLCTDIHCVFNNSVKYKVTTASRKERGREEVGLADRDEILLKEEEKVEPTLNSSHISLRL
jgi:hypothetical protein